MRYPPHSTHHRRTGAILVIAMFVLIVLTSLALVYARTTRVEALGSANRMASAQARAVAYGAAQAVLAMGIDAPAEAVEVGGGAYWIIKPDGNDDKAHAFGLIDEASKLNINSAPEESIELLPGMNTELAAAIVDWRDTDSDVESAGAESEYYTLLEDPYDAKNEPLETVEELLLVRDFTVAEVYGEDLNQNGVLDANEDDGGAADPPDDNDGELDRGLVALATVYSFEPTSGKVNINAIARQGGGAGSRPGSGSGGGGRGGSGRPAGGGSAPGGVDVEAEFLRLLQEHIGGGRAEAVYDLVRRQGPFRNVMDFFYKAQLTVEEFNRIEPLVTTTGGERTAGLVNINTAPREVLMALPTLEESDADAIVAGRAGQADTSTSVPASSSGASVGSTAAASPHDPTGGTGQSLGWITDVLPQEKVLAIGGMITTRSYQYSADIVAVSGDGRAYERYRMVYDVSGGTPRVLYWKRLTHLGWPLDPSILTALRSGTKLADLPRSATARSSF